MGSQSRGPDVSKDHPKPSTGQPKEAPRGDGKTSDDLVLLKFLVESSAECVFWTDDRGKFLGVNDNTCRLLGYSRDELLSMRVSDIDSNVTPASHEILLEELNKYGTVTVQTQPQRKDGSFLSYEFDVKQLVVDGKVYLCTLGREIVLEKQLHDRVLQAMATGMPLPKKISLIIELAEKTRSKMIANVMLLDKSNTLRSATATKLPESFLDMIQGLQPGASTGSCGTAAFLREPAMVADVTKSDLWKPYLGCAQDADIRACWSEPIFSSKDEILGTFSMYFAVPQFPTDHDKKLIKTFAYMAGIAIEREREQLELRKSERQLRTVTDSLPVMISYIDNLYHYKFINATYETIFKRPRSEFRGLHVRDVIGAESFLANKPFFDQAFTGISTTFEARIETPEGARIVEIRLVPDVAPSKETMGVYCLIDDITQRRSLEKEVLNVATEEQRKIGQDLHDGTGQELTGLGMIADTLMLSLHRQESDEKVIADKLAKGIKRVLHQIKSLARGLNPVDISPDGLRSALFEMTTHAEDLYGIHCSCQIDGEIEVRDNQVATQLFRIAQEATTNAAKHSKGSKITIDLRLDGAEIVLAVSDDGVGISPNREKGFGMGLRSMKYRAGLIGGAFEVNRIDIGGTKVSCRIPHSHLKNVAK